MFTLADVPVSKVSLSKDLVAVPTFQHLTVKANTSGRVFDANGLGTGASATSTVVLVHAGGFDDQRITGVMKYVAPTAAGAEDFGVMARFQSFDDTSSTTYYYARCSLGVAKLSKVVGGTFTNLSTTPFALAQGVEVTIMLQCVGSALTATFTAAGGVPATKTLTATDASIPTGGLMGFRTLNSTGYCKSFLAEQL